MSEDAAKNWADNAEKCYNLSVEKFAEYVKKYCDKKGENHHVLFLVDEIGQYIADDSKLMLNLQTVTEDLGTACGGRHGLLSLRSRTSIPSRRPWARISLRFKAASRPESRFRQQTRTRSSRSVFCIKGRR